MSGYVFNDSVTCGPRRCFGLLPGKIIVERTPVPIPTGVTVTDGRMGSEPEREATLGVQLTPAELNTIVLALKFSSIRYGMLLQLADQRGGTILSWEAIGGLEGSLERTLDQAVAT